MDHLEHTRLQEDELTNATLAGATVYGPDDDALGTVEHVHGSGGDTSVVVAVGGKLVTGSNSVSISILDLTFMRDDHGTIHAITSLTSEDLQQMPKHLH